MSRGNLFVLETVAMVISKVWLFLQTWSLVEKHCLHIHDINSYPGKMFPDSNSPDIMPRVLATKDIKYFVFSHVACHLHFTVLFF